MDERPAVSGPAFEAQQSFDLESFARTYGGVTRATFKSGARLFAQGEPANCVFYIQEGQVEIVVVSDQGKEAILSIIDPGDFCGESCLFADKARGASALCIADCVTARLERASIIRAIQQDPLFAEFFIARVLTRAFRLRDNLISQLFDDTERRLARVLMLLAEHGKNGGADTAIDNLDQEQLAQMVGTTRSRVNYFMNKFRKLGYIDYNGRIDIHRSLLNAVIRDDLTTAPKDGQEVSG